MTPRSPRRVASVIKLRPEHEQAYRELHAEVWPSVLDRIARSNVHNYSIFLHDGLLISYFEHRGDDYEADMAAMAADPETQRWWALCMPMQERLPETPDGEWWCPVQELFHTD